MLKTREMNIMHVNEYFTKCVDKKEYQLISIFDEIPYGSKSIVEESDTFRNIYQKMISFLDGHPSATIYVDELNNNVYVEDGYTSEDARYQLKGWDENLKLAMCLKEYQEELMFDIILTDIFKEGLHQ